MLRRQSGLKKEWIILLFCVGWSVAVAGQGLDLPYSGSVSQYNGPAFEIQNQVRILPEVPTLSFEQSSSILGRYSFTGPVVGMDYQNIGRLGSHSFGVEGICGTKNGYGVRAENKAESGTGLYAKGGPQGLAAMFDGSVFASKSISLCNAGTATNAWSDGLIIGDNKGGVFGILGTQGTHRLGITWNGYRLAPPAKPNEWEVIGINGSDTTAQIMMGTDGISLCVEGHKADGDPEPAVRMKIDSSGDVGIGTNDPRAKLHVEGNAIVREKLTIVSKDTDKILLELGEGFDYAEGFDVSDGRKVGPGTVLVIDPENPGNLTISTTAYDTKVAGIVAGAKGLGSGVRLGTGQSDHDVALAGRVYCNVDATEASVEPGDLLTTSATAGHAMKVSDHLRAQGAILSKAMERLEKGHKAQILVLVTLQ